jgi:hypothetical protein
MIMNNVFMMVHEMTCIASRDITQREQSQHSGVSRARGLESGSEREERG